MSQNKKDHKRLLWKTVPQHTESPRRNIFNLFKKHYYENSLVIWLHSKDGKD